MAQSDKRRGEREFVPGQLLIRFKPYITEEDAQEIVSNYGAKVIKYLNHLGIYLVEIGEEKSLDEALRYFRGLQEVDYAEPNYKLHIQ